MRRAFLAFLACGCASAAPVPDETTPRQPTILVSEQGVLLGEKPRAAVATIAAPAEVVWLAVKKVYAGLEIPLTVENPASHQLGNPNFIKARTMGGHPMTEFVDCGSGMTGPKAASYRIYMSLLTEVSVPAPGQTRVQTTFVATGQDVAAGSSDRIACGTTGRFEQYVLDHVKAEIGHP